MSRTQAETKGPVVKLMTIARTRAALAVGVIAVGLTVAACGSSSSSSSGGTTASRAASASATAAGGRGSAFRTCLEKHGVTLPNRRPPGAGGSPGGGPPGGGFFGGGGGGGGAGGAGGAGGRFNNPKFRAALQACGGSARFRGGAGARRFQLSHTAVNNFVACVRKSGYPQMPNPNFSSGAIFPTSIRSNKQFQTAARKCQSLLRPARPSGTSTNPGA
jgi:hypothetical protein